MELLLLMFWLFFAGQKLSDNAVAISLVLTAPGEACLEEHSEWLLTHRERPPEPSGLQS